MLMDSGHLQKLKGEARAKLLRYGRCGGRISGDDECFIRSRYRAVCKEGT